VSAGIAMLLAGSSMFPPKRFMLVFTSRLRGKRAPCRQALGRSS
jgi:hypothetical protein